MFLSEKLSYIIRNPRFILTCHLIILKVRVIIKRWYFFLLIILIIIIDLSFFISLFFFISNMIRLMWYRIVCTIFILDFRDFFDDMNDLLMLIFWRFFLSSLSSKHSSCPSTTSSVLRAWLNIISIWMCLVLRSWWHYHIIVRWMAVVVHYKNPS